MGSGGGPNVSKKSHKLLVINGMGGSVPTEDKGGIDAMGTKSEFNRFVIRGLYGGKQILQ